jgi:hypothetical protein
MSWSIHVPAGVDVEQVVKDWEARQEQAGVTVLAETREQIQTALAASKLIAESGALGDGLVYLNLSGHANEGHEPEAGWSQDMVTVSVSRAAPAA